MFGDGRRSGELWVLNSRVSLQRREEGKRSRRSFLAVSSFQPTNITVEPPDPPDYLAGALVQGLSRPIGSKQYWGVAKSLVLGVLSFGVLPILSWVQGFKRFAIAEQQQFLHLAQWVSANSDHPMARQLESDARELRPRGVLNFVAGLILVAMAGRIAMLCVNHPIDFNALIHLTYGMGRGRLVNHLPLFHFVPRIFEVWVFGLGLAYLVHLFQIYLHAQDVKRFVARFSEIATSEGVNRVKADSIGVMVWPLWIVGGVALLLAGAPWGIPAMLAGGAQRRYITWTSRNTRSDVAQRLRAMVQRRRPGTHVASPVYLRDRCIGVRCRAEMPRGANFCPRCGTRQKSRVNQVA
jgi:hypothetical protein